MSEKILIVNFGAFGDIINSTPIAEHYKTIDNNNIVKWLTRTKYSSVLKSNPYIDEILTINESTLPDNYVVITKITKSLITQNFSDYKIIFSAPYMSPLYDGTPRSSLIDILKNECSGILDWSCSFVPTVVVTSEQEQEADLFMGKLRGAKTVLIEHESLSSQSLFDEECVKFICNKLKNKNCNIVFSGKNPPSYFENLKNLYNLNFYFYSGSFISNARLYNLSDYFIGCSSGISCLTHIKYCDTSIPRIEYCKGPHWSTQGYTHMLNKKIAYSIEDFKNFINGIEI